MQPTHVIAGVGQAGHVESVLKHKGLDSNSVTILAQACNRVIDIHSYKVITIREQDEARLPQLVRLFTNLREIQSASYYWRPEIGLSRNILGIILLSWFGGLRTEVISQGETWPLSSFLISRCRLKVLKPEPIGWIVAFAALFFFFLRGSHQWLVGKLRGFARWFRSNSTTRSQVDMSQFLARASMHHFELNERLRSNKRSTKTLAMLTLILRATTSFIFGCIYWPWVFAKRLSFKQPQKKYVLLVSHESRLNGAPSSLVTILDSLDRNEFEPFLLSASEGLLTKRARKMGVPVFVLPLSQLLTQHPSRKGVLAALATVAVNFPYILYLLGNLRISIVHSNVLVTPDVAMVAKSLGILNVWHFRECIKDDRWAWITVRLMNLFADRIFCNSDYSRQILNRKGIFWPKMVTVYNALDRQSTTPTVGCQVFRHSLGLNKDNILIGCVGQITPVKGQETFVRAAIKIAQKYPNTHFVLVGTLENTEYVGHIRELITQASLDHRIKLCGFRTDIHDIMAGLDIHVTPSIWAEPFGRVALEAMGAGAVSVVSNIGGLPEIVEDGLSGMHFPPGDVDALISILSRLITDRDFRVLLCRNGKRRALTVFSVERQTDIIQQTYRYPRAETSRITHFRAWTFIRKFLPGRLRPHPKLLVYYPPLVVYVLLLWATLLPIFFLTLPIAMLVGAIKRYTSKTHRVAVLAYQTVRNASTRHRITKLFEFLPSNKIEVRIFYPSSNRMADKVYVSLFYGNSPHIRDFYFYAVVFPRRLFAILSCYSYDTTVIQYELFFEGPMWMELLVAKTHPRTIYDYDDSLYIFPRYARWLPRIIKATDHIVVGNHHISEYTRQFNPNLTVVPTCPNHDIYLKEPVHSMEPDDQKPINIGWIGNPANLFYLPMVKGAIRKLSTIYKIRFVIVSAGPYDTKTLEIDDLPLHRKEWDINREGEDIESFDIGIMPVIDDELGKGKCGFKALQYMAAGIPCVVSPVGANADIIEHGTTGFLANSEEDWYQYLTKLIKSGDLRKTLGRNARTYTLEHYNIRSWASVWLSLLQ